MLRYTQNVLILHHVVNTDETVVYFRAAVKLLEGVLAVGTTRATSWGHQTATLPT